MSVKKRLIPKICIYRDVQTGRIKAAVTKNYKNLVSVGQPSSLLRIFDANLVDEIIVVNIDPDKISITETCDLISDLSKELMTPLTVGGGLNSIDDASRLFALGIEKVNFSFNVMNQNLIFEIANKYGQQAINLSINYANDSLAYTVDKKCVPIFDVSNSVNKAINSGAGEVLLLSLDRDGCRNGLDLDTLLVLFELYKGIPFLIGCGAGSASHFIDAFRSGASGVVASTYFSKLDQNPLQLRSIVKNAGIDIR
jgi:cyclase